MSNKSKPLDPHLYQKAIAYVNKIYGEQTSAYRSMAIVKEYKRLGGKYSAKSKSNNTNIWLKEKWIKVTPFVKENKKIPCGSRKDNPTRSDRRQHACRPLIRVSEATPITIKEAIDKHGKDKIIELAKYKRKCTENYRVDWNKGIVKKIKSKAKDSKNSANQMPKDKTSKS